MSDKHLKFIAEHLKEWPDDELKKVCVDIDGEVLFNKYAYDFYPMGFSERDQIFDHASDWYTSEQWQEARNELLDEYVPEVGDVVDITYASKSHTLENCTINYISDSFVLYEFEGKELCFSLSAITITPRKPEPTPQDIMLEDWRSFNSLDEAYDNMMSTARIGDVFDALVKAGWTKGEDK